MALTSNPISAATLEELDGSWEIFQGKLRKKPSMSVGHNRISRKLVRLLDRQLSPREFEILHNDGRTGLADGDSYIPDVAIVPIELLDAFEGNPRRFETYSSSLPLVVEIWSPSTGKYDIDAKLPGYQKRGDLEIWRIHPFDRTVKIWRRQTDGANLETIEQSRIISLHALPEVRIDLDDLFRIGWG